MKKLLTFLTLFTLFFGVGWAETVTFTLTGLTNSTSVVYTGESKDGIVVSAQKDEGTTPPTYYKNGDAVRFYQNNVLEISSPTHTITKIEFTSSNSTLGNFTAITGNYSNGTWAGTSQNVAFNVTKAARLTKIVVTYTSGGSTPQPTTYSVNLTQTTGGTISANPTTAEAGATVTLTATPNDGYDFTSWTVLDGNANEVTVNNNQFTMPASDVEVEATFTEQSVTPTTNIKFERITSLSDLEVGKRYIIVCGNNALSGTRAQYGITISNYSTELPSDTQVNIYTLGGTTDAYTFLTGAYYMANTGTTNSTSLNHTDSPTEADMAQWKVSFGTSDNAVIQCVHHFGTESGRYLRGNGTSDFRCYTGASTGNPVYLYKEVEEEAQVDDLYLIGYGMNGTENWNLTTAPQMTYSTSAGTYAVDVYFDKAQRGMFQFAKGLSSSNSDWNGLTGRLYPSTNGSNVNVDTYDMDGTVGLYFTDNSNMYSFELPAGLYTITANLSEWKTYVTQKPVTMTISPNSATFETTKNVTLASNLTDLGGKIYYTTDGSTPSATNGTEYTGTITLEATTTIKAIAILNYIQSEVVEKTYTKAPAAPVITPASCTFNEPLTVTITAESGATIYYTTDGSTPTDQSTQYTGPFTVSTTTTVKAIAYVNGVYGATATETYTYSNVQPSTGDFVLVTSADQLVAGNEYIIVAKYNGSNYAMGTISGNKGQSTNDFTLNGTIGTSGSTIAAGNAVNVLTLEASGSNWKFKLSDNSYIEMPSSTNITTSNSGTAMTITLDNNLASIVGTSSTTRLILFSASNSVFGNYASSNAGASGYSNGVYLYTRESNAVQPPVFTPAGGIYDVTVDVTISCATTGASIYYTTDGSEPSATNGTLYDGNEIVVSNDATFKAVAVKNGNTSSVVTAEYTIAPHTAIETVTLTYSEPFTSGIGKFTVQNVSGYSPVWTLDGNYGIKGTAYSPNTNPTNNAATSRFLSPIIDMTDAVQPELTFSHQINSYFTNVTNQCQLFIRETTNGTDGTWVQLPITFSDPAANGGWTNDLVDIDLSNYAGKKVQISFLYTNPTAGSGAGTWEIQNFVVADNSEYRLVNNIAEFLALENGTKAKFKNPVTVLYDYAQYSSNSYHEYIWVKDNSGFMQFYLIPTLNSSTESSLDAKAAYYENGDIIPAGFVVVKNYYENGKYVQAYSAEALEAGFLPATQKGLADPEYMDFDVLDALDASDTEDVATWCNHYITLEKIKLTSSSKNFNFENEDGNQNSCVGYNKYNGDGSLLKDGTNSADVIMPTDLTKFYDVKGIIQLWQGGWEFMPIEFTEWKADEVTLRQLCQDGVVGQSYTISNNVLGVYAKDNRVWVKDDTGQSIWMTAPGEDEKSYEIEAPGNTRSEQAYYDQSNWVEVVLPGDTNNPTDASYLVGKIINGGQLTGQFTNKVNPTLVVTSLPDAGAASSYEPNYYCMANFVDFTGEHLTQHSDIDGNDYFFMNPKPQEYAVISWAMWDGAKFIIPAKGTQEGKDGKTYYVNYWDFNGAVDVEWSLNAAGDVSDDLLATDTYQFNAIVCRKGNSTLGSATPKPNQEASSKLVIYPTDLEQDNAHVITAVNDVKAAGEVLSVTYYNVAGMQSSKPFDGINIVVTRYTDGTSSTAKVVK